MANCLTLKDKRTPTPVLAICLAAAERGNQNSLSDSGVGGSMALAGAEGAYYNVLINLQGMEDEAYVNETRTKAYKLMVEASDGAAQVKAVIGKGLGF